MIMAALRLADHSLKVIENLFKQTSPLLEDILFLIFIIRVGVFVFYT